MRVGDICGIFGDLKFYLNTVVAILLLVTFISNNEQFINIILISSQTVQRMSVITFNEFQFKYRFDCQLSQGSFGKVCRIQEIQTKKYFALKKVTVKKKQQLEDIQNQIKLLFRFRHPFVVQIKETYNIQIKSGFAKPIGEVGLVMELAKCSLQHVIRTKKAPGPPPFIIDQTAGLIQILFILQKQNIAHRDIKPANILVFEDSHTNPHWKIADFGLSLDLNSSKEEESFAGSFQYASPKLKRKFKYPSLKIKCNPFKNDVYSLGVTLLETITGFRVYNQASSDKLREFCGTEHRLMDLIDIMLEQDQQKRPCFKQLMMLLQKDFSQQIQSLQSPNPKTSTSTSTPQHQKNHQKHHLKHHHHSHQNQPQNDQIYDKTVVKKTQQTKTQPKKTIFHVGKPVQCVANLDGIVMCGCDNGELVFVKDGDVVQAGLVHRRYVSQLFQDAKGNIWSVGGDNFIKKWHKTTLIKSLLTDTKPTTKTIQNFLKKPTTTTTQTLPQNPTLYQKIDLPFHHSTGISCIYAVDTGHFAVGYYDGYVYVRWGHNGEYHGRMFGGTVTGIKGWHGQRQQGEGKEKGEDGDGDGLFFCGIDGQVKGISTRTLVPENRLFFRKGYNFMGLQICQRVNQPPLLTILSIQNHQILLKPTLQLLYQTHSQKPPILAWLQTPTNYFTLTQNGQIMDSNEEKLIQLGSKGWNCLAALTDREIVAGSFLGVVAVVEW